MGILRDEYGDTKGDGDSIDIVQRHHEDGMGILREWHGDTKGTVWEY